MEGKFLVNFLEECCKRLGFSIAEEKIEMKNIIGSKHSRSQILATLIYFFIVFFRIITAVEILGLSRLTEILNEILEVTGQIIFGLIILAIGNYISLLIYKTMIKSSNNTFIAGVIRWASLALFLAIALRTMGIANEIVELAFGLILGAIAVAVALSYGLGGREAAGEHFKDIVRKMRSEAADMPAEKTPDTTGNRPLRSGNEPHPGSSRKEGGTNDPTLNPENPNRPSRDPENPNKPGQDPTDPTDPPLI